MATPRVSINELPEQTTVSDGDLLVVQDETTTKKMTVGRLTEQSESAISAHIANLDDAHDASAISVSPSGQLSSSNVQAALIELQAEIEAGSGSGVSEEEAVDAVAQAFAVGTHTNITVTYSDVANSISLTAGGGSGTAGRATYTFNAGTTEPPGGNQLRLNSATQSVATKMWMSQTDASGFDVSVGLGKIKAGHQIYFQDSNDGSQWVKYTVVSDGVDEGAYFDFNVEYHSGPASVPFGSVEFQPVVPGATGIPPGGDVGQVVGKTSVADFAVGWVDMTGGGGGGITTEQAVDATALALANGTHTNISVTYNDAADSLSLAATGLVTSAQLTAHEADTTSVHGIGDTSTLYRSGGTDVAVGDGGTGRSSHTVSALIAGGTSTTSAQQSIPNGTAGNFLKSAGTGGLPAFAAITPSDVSGLGTLASLSTVTSSVIADGTVATIDLADDAVTNDKLANLAANRLKGAETAGSPVDLTPSQARAVIASDSGDTGLFFRGDGAFAAPPGGGGGISGVIVQTDDVTVSAAATTLDFGNGLDVTESPVGEANVVLDLSEYSGAALPVSAGGTGATSAGAALVALGGQPSNAILDDIAGLTQATDKLPYFSSASAMATTDLSSTARTLLDDTSTAAMLTTLGAQPADADLTTIASLTATTNNVIQSVGSAWASRTPAQLKTTLSLTSTDVGLGNVTNTSDANKPVSTAQQTALDAKVTNVSNVTGIWSGNQAAYDALTPVSTVLYVIV